MPFGCVIRSVGSDTDPASTYDVRGVGPVGVDDESVCWERYLVRLQGGFGIVKSVFLLRRGAGAGWSEGF